MSNSTLQRMAAVLFGLVILSVPVYLMRDKLGASPAPAQNAPAQVAAETNVAPPAPVINEPTGPAPLPPAPVAMPDILPVPVPTGAKQEFPAPPAEGTPLFLELRSKLRNGDHMPLTYLARTDIKTGSRYVTRASFLESIFLEQDMARCGKALPKEHVDAVSQLYKWQDMGTVRFAWADDTRTGYSWTVKVIPNLMSYQTADQARVDFDGCGAPQRLTAFLVTPRWIALEEPCQPVPGESIEQSGCMLIRATIKPTIELLD